MKRFIALWAVMAMWTAMGCAADVEEGAAPVDTPDSEEHAIFQFSPSVFKFVVTVPDDGTDVAGGTLISQDDYFGLALQREYEALQKGRV